MLIVFTKDEGVETQHLCLRSLTLLVTQVLRSMVLDVLLTINYVCINTIPP